MSKWRRASVTIIEQNQPPVEDYKKTAILKGALSKNWSKAVSFVTDKIQQDPLLLKDCETSKFISLGPEDILVASFPKSGSVRVSQIVANLLNHATKIHSPDGCADTISSQIPCFEKTEETLTDEALTAGVRLLTSNIRYEYLASSVTNSKVIYVVRDPRHAALELYNFSFIKHCSFKEFVDVFIGEAEDGNPYNYKTHFLQFLDNKQQLDILFLKFEDIDLRPATALRELSAYLGLNLSLTPGEVSDIVNKTEGTEGHDMTSWDRVARSIRTDNFASFFDRDIQARFDKELKVDWGLVKTGTV